MHRLWRWVTRKPDWRLSSEEDWMYEARLVRRVFTAPTPDWDHEHCRLCYATFNEPPADGLHEGLVLPDETGSEPLPVEDRTNLTEGGRIVASPTEDVWFCDECFGDFQSHFGWTVVATDD